MAEDRSPTPEEPARILVVDDTPQNIRLLEAVLTPRGYEVLAAGSGQQALDMVEGTRPDLVLLDVVMPGMDGYEVCRQLRREPATRMLPVVMITASGNEQKIKAIEAGADDFIAKPLDQQELLARVTSLLRIKRYHDTIEAQARELAELSASLEARVKEQVGEIERLDRLRRFLPPQVVDLIVSSGDESIVDSHRRDITVVVCGLHGFTAFSETAQPEEVMSVLRDYHAAVGELGFAFGGTLDRFAADEVTVLFNDPLPCDDPPRTAVEMALAIRDQVARLSAGWRRQGHDLDLVAGMAMGYATVGKVGFDRRFEYGAVGTVMHLAQRLCHEAGGGEILASQRVGAAIEAAVDIQPVEDVDLAGFVRPGLVYRVLGLKGAEPPLDGEAALQRELGRISQREREVAALIARGYSNRDIAGALVITEGTAANHVEHILTKLGFTSRAQVAAWATEHSLA